MKIKTIGLWEFYFDGWFRFSYSLIGKRKEYDFNEYEYHFYRTNWEKYRDEFKKSYFFETIKDNEIRYINLTNLEMRLENLATEINNELLRVYIFKNILNSLCIKLKQDERVH